MGTYSELVDNIALHEHPVSVWHLLGVARVPNLLTLGTYVATH